jgi:hypothetical protein
MDQDFLNGSSEAFQLGVSLVLSICIKVNMVRLYTMLDVKYVRTLIYLL